MYVVVEQLRADRSTVTYRAVDDVDGRHVTIKALTPRHEPRDLERLRNEYELCRDLELRSALVPIAWDTHLGLPALIAEDFGGETLERSAREWPMEVGRFLELASRIAAALAPIHEHDVVHRNLKPENIAVHRDTGEVKILDFGIAARVSAARAGLEARDLVEGTLPYLAPEQTGRLHRSVDQRADLYSLGVTFYEMLTGRLPWRASDPLEWIHSHVARRPVHPAELIPSIPEALSAILLKLLAKEPDDRYQSARGLLHDLDRCREAWSASRAIPPFPLGRRDFSDRLRIPQKLYAREAELAFLRAALGRALEGGAPEIVLVTGAPGIGKSALVRELRAPVLAAHGRFVAAKFELARRDVPYAELVRAFREPLLQILAADSASVARWRERLGAALGSNAGVITELLPEAARLLGGEPPPPLPPLESQNRFRHVLRAFVGALGGAGDPLVLFLDDLQWCDAATLDLLPELLAHAERGHLLVIAAYRKSAVRADHPVARATGALRRAGVPVSTLELEALGGPAIAALIADALRRAPADVAPLAALVRDKTAGNPLFTRQFLSSLHEEHLLSFDRAESAWRWDLDRVRAASSTDNVTELMIERLRRLSPRGRDAVQRLACFGHRARIPDLALVSARPADEIRGALEEALGAGLVSCSAEACEFVHDRVEEVAYSLVSSRPAQHAEIARRLLAGLSRAEIERRVFEIVHHFERGAPALEGGAEAEQLFELSLLAARKARASGAWASARSHLERAERLLGADAWESRYETTLALHLELAECEYLVGHFARSGELFDVALAHARTSLDAARAFRLRTQLYQVSGRLGDGLAAALEGLARFGIAFPDTEAALRAAAERTEARVRAAMEARTADALSRAPLAGDLEARAIIGLLVDAQPCAFSSRPEVFPMVVLEALERTLRSGHTEDAPLVYSGYAVMLAAVRRDVARADELADLALAIARRLGARRQEGQVLLRQGFFVHPWRRPLAEVLPTLERAFAVSLEVGNHAYAGYAALLGSLTAFERGLPLDEVSAILERYERRLGAARNEPIHLALLLERQMVRCLKGLTRGPADLGEGEIDEAERAAALRATGFGPGIGAYFVWKQAIEYLAGNHQASLEAADSAARCERQIAAVISEASHSLYRALALAALHRGAAESERPALRARIDRERARLAGWARECPANFEHRHLLVAAELARIDERPLDAMRLYQDAIRSSREAGVIPGEALANELAAAFYRERGLARVADTHLQDALASYVRWGADAKVRMLERALGVGPLALAPSATVAVTGNQLDVLSVVKASQAISRERVLADVLRTLVRVAMEQAGAQRGSVFLVSDGRPVGETEARLVAHAGGERIHVEVGGAPGPLARSVPMSVVRSVLATQESVLLDDALASERFASDEYIVRARPRSLLCLPIVRKADVIGILYLENDLVTGAFGPERLEVLELLASQAAISMENALLLSREESARRAAESAARRTSFLAAASQLLGSSLEHRRVLAELAELTAREIADWCTVDLLRGDLVRGDLVRSDGAIERVGESHRDPSKLALLQALQRRHPARPGSPHPASRVIANGEPLVLPVVSDAILESFCEDEHHAGLVRALGTTSLIAVPLVVRASAVGAICAGAEGDARRFGAPELALMQELARRAAIAVDNALLYHSAQEAVRLRDEFLQVASHELRTPMTSLTLALQALKQSAAAGRLEPAQVLRSATLAERQGGRLATLIGGLLDVTTIDEAPLALSRERVDAVKVARDVASRLGHDLARAGCSVAIDAALPVIGNWDRARLEQILTSLVSNSLKFAPGTTIEVSVAARVDRAVIAVRDHGPGIAPERQAHLFERFERGVSARHYGGLGLGLYLCRRIVEAHGGAIRADSQPGRGATFTVELPGIERAGAEARPR